MRSADRSRAIEAGYQQRRIQESAYRVQREIEAGERIVVGVNRFRDDAPGGRAPIQRIDPQAERARSQGSGGSGRSATRRRGRRR